jgi:hypothetical protein
MARFNGESVIMEQFFGKEFRLEKIDPSTVRISTDTSSSLICISGDLHTDVVKDFYERPYLIRFTTKVHLAPGSTRVIYLAVPLVTKLVLANGAQSVQIDDHREYARKAWYGEVHNGILCTYVEAEYALDMPLLTTDAIAMVRLVNRSTMDRAISKVMLEPKEMCLMQGDNGLFTNEITVHVLSSTEFHVDYTTTCPGMVQNPRTVVERRISAGRLVLEKFDKFGISREFGL